MLEYPPVPASRFLLSGVFVGGCKPIELLRAVPLVDLAPYWSANYGTCSRSRRYIIYLVSGDSPDGNFLSGAVSHAGTLEAPDGLLPGTNSPTNAPRTARWPSSILSGCESIGQCGPDYTPLGYGNPPACIGDPPRVALPDWSSLVNVGPHYPGRVIAHNNLYWREPSSFFCFGPCSVATTVLSIGIYAIFDALRPVGLGPGDTLSVSVTDSDYLVWGLPNLTNYVVFLIYS